MKPLSLLVMLAATTIAVPAYAATTINFDEPNITPTVDGFYNGGGGGNLGIDFLAGDWAITTAFGQTSQPNLAFSNSGLGSFNIANGFTGALSFSYGGFSDTIATVFSGVNGTGSALATVNLLTNNPFSFDLATINFSGVGRSFVISGGAAQFGFDDITFTSAMGGVPEPATWAMMMLGFGAAGGMMRYRRRKTSVSFA